MNEKIQILVVCPACAGHAYLPTSDEISISSRKYIRHVPCSACGGSGKQVQWISIVDFTRMLHAIMAEEQPA
jgi:DnaJ-class molecular chaperone